MTESGAHGGHRSVDAAPVLPRRSCRAGPAAPVLPRRSCRAGPAAPVLPLRSCRSGPGAPFLPRRSCRSGPAAPVLPLRSCRSGPGAPVVRGTDGAVPSIGANRLAEAEAPMRRHVEIFVKFTVATGHPNPHLEAAFGNYAALLQQSGRSETEIQQLLAEVTRPLSS